MSSGGKPGQPLPGLRQLEQLLAIQYQVLAVHGGKLLTGPGVVHRDRVEVADLDADVAAHAAAVVDEELIEYFAALAGALCELWVVLHRHGHAFDRAGTLAGVAAGAKRLVDVEVVEQDGEGSVAFRQLLVGRWVLDGYGLAKHRGHRDAQGLQYADHWTLLTGVSVAPTRISRGA